MFISEKLISIVAPHQCVMCGSEGAVVCDWCLPDFSSPVPSRCYRCQAATEQSRVCQTCRRRVGLKHVWVRTTYDGAMKQLLHDFKFARKRAAAEVLATLVYETLPYLPAETVVTHIPTASSRIRIRGYDHAQLLAKALARQANLRYAPLLGRRGHVRQVGAKRQQRLTQLEGVFWIREQTVVSKASVLLIDDIVTTGGTLQAAAACLRTAGAKTIDAAVCAQKTVT